ncbi:MAG: plastocyanin/azurin family copper-binding protein [Candidatus Buchananbacteria bacterium]
MRKFFVFSSIASIAIVLSGCSLFPVAPAVPQTPIVTPTVNTSESLQNENVPPETPVSQDQPPVQAALTRNIEMRNYSFNSATVTINRGTTVIWTNFDSAPHDVVADNKSFSSSLFGQGQSYSFTFTTIGTYTYYCSVHPSMKGTIIVK